MSSLNEYISAFVIGGLLCVIAQILMDKTKLTPARILVGYVVAGVALTALGIYAPLVKIAGSGALTPLTGFGYVLANGVTDAVDKNGLAGVLSGGLTAASAGITAAIVFGYIIAIIFKGKPKK